MTQDKHDKAARVSSQDLAQAARAGVTRALAARQAMAELTPEQVQHVSGAGATVAKAPIVGLVIKPPVVKPPVCKPPVVKPPVIAGFLPAPVPADPLL